MMNLKWWEDINWKKYHEDDNLIKTPQEIIDKFYEEIQDDFT